MLPPQLTHMSVHKFPTDVGIQRYIHVNVSEKKMHPTLVTDRDTWTGKDLFGVHNAGAQVQGQQFYCLRSLTRVSCVQGQHWDSHTCQKTTTSLTPLVCFFWLAGTQLTLSFCYTLYPHLPQGLPVYTSFISEGSFQNTMEVSLPILGGWKPRGRHAIGGAGRPGSLPGLSMATSYLCPLLTRTSVRLD